MSNAYRDLKVRRKKVILYIGSKGLSVFCHVNEWNAAATKGMK
jgi:hypothetical protein